MLALVLGIVFGTHTFHLTDTPTGSEWRLPYGELVRPMPARILRRKSCRFLPSVTSQGNAVMLRTMLRMTCFALLVVCCEPQD